MVGRFGYHYSGHVTSKRLLSCTFENVHYTVSQTGISPTETSHYSVSHSNPK